MNQVILTLEETSKILHDIKFALMSIAKTCEPIAGITNRLEDAVNNLIDAQDRLNRAIEEMKNNGSNQ